MNEAVKLARIFGHEGVAKFTNGLLRQLIRKKDTISYPDWERDPVLHLGLKYSFPSWMVEHWLSWLGPTETAMLCQALNETPKLNIRVNTVKTSVPELRDYLTEQGISSAPGKFAPDVLEVSPAGLVVKDQALARGMYYIQDESSALAAHALQVEAGQTVYDLCSAPGGKTTHLAQLMNNQGQIFAFDASGNRLALVEENARRLGITIIETTIRDATETWNLPPGPRVLVDAPCSGLGTMNHRPDIRWNKTPQEIKELVNLQRKILSAASKAVAPGGLLLYSTCTLTKDENQDVAHWFLQEHTDFSGASFPAWFPPGETEWMRTILPHHHGLDGFFLAVFRKQRR